MKMAKMSHCIHCQDSPDDGYWPMEESNVSQPTLDPKGKKL